MSDWISVLIGLLIILVAISFLIFPVILLIYDHPQRGAFLRFVRAVLLKMRIIQPDSIVIQLMNLESQLKTRWAAAEGMVMYFGPVMAVHSDNLAAVDEVESEQGLLAIVGDADEATSARVEFYNLVGQTTVTIPLHQIREYARLSAISQVDFLTIAIYSEAGDGWRADHFGLHSPQAWRGLEQALQRLCAGAPARKKAVGPMTAMGFQQDMLGQWVQTQPMTLYLISTYLLLDWRDSIALDQIREVTVLPATGILALIDTMLCIKYMSSDQRMHTVGFGLDPGSAYSWADRIHELSGAPRTLAERRKKK